MLTPTTSTNNGIRRRSSIRRGTIASISKDVRVSDVVEIIKKQKALQLQERTVVEEKLLQRRHSMMNLNRPATKSKQQVSNNHGKQQQTNAATAKVRLAEEDEGVFQHLRKCVACRNHEDCSSSSDEDNCPSPSTSSSSSDMMRPFIKQQENEDSDTLLDDVEQRGQIIQSLNSSITGYSTEIKEFINNSAYYNEQEYKSKMNKCKTLVAQQQSLLDRLETAYNDPPMYSAPSPILKHPTPISTCTSTSPIKSLYTEIYKGFKSSTTGFTIKQKKDKNDADTIISVQGVCTTVESSLIPDRVSPLPPLFLIRRVCTNLWIISY